MNSIVRAVAIAMIGGAATALGGELAKRVADHFWPEPKPTPPTPPARTPRRKRGRRA